jgi:NADH dehydrogenase
VVAADLAGKFSDVSLADSGRVAVQPDLSVKGYPDVFVIGDLACCVQDGKPLPMMAPVASQQGDYAARMILAREQGRSLPAFHYFDKGAMATIGRSSAVAVAAGFKFRGYIAWLAWLILHLYYLIGFRNRLVVMMNWTYAYWFQERQVRIITSKKRRASL